MEYKYWQYGTILRVDIDKKSLSFFTIKGLQLLSRKFKIQKIILKKSPSKKGWHLVVCLSEYLNDSEIIAWQYTLGSDKYRERYNLLRYTDGNSMQEWNLLFPNKVNRSIKL